MSSTQNKKMSIQAVVQLVRGSTTDVENSTVDQNLENLEGLDGLNAVDEQSAGKKLSQANYQWRLCDEDGLWKTNLHSGSVQQFRDAFPSNATDIQVCLLLSGTEVITQSVPINIKERRHLQKLVPYELEDNLTDEIDDLHFALATPSENEVVTAYVNDEWFSSQIEDLESAGFEVSHCFSEPLMLPREENTWTLRLDDQLHVHYGHGLGFTVEQSLASIVLTSLAEKNTIPEKIVLLAADQYHIDLLFQYLPEALKHNLQDNVESDPDDYEAQSSPSKRLEARIAEGWDSLDIAHVADLDLRQGGYARQLPLKKWWSEWRNVSFLGLAALLIYVGVNIAQIQVFKSKRADVVAERSAVFSQVVKGREQNAEKQLKNKIAEYETTSSTGSVIEMYALVAPLITDNKDVNLRTLRYTGQTGDMQLTLEAKSYGSVLALSEEINKKGLQARLQNTSQQGEQQQARMVISRAAL
ncbi:MAG: type II secretion system protein GspL [Cellvibrionaceae bacterium]